MADIEQFLVERFQQFDPSISTERGSRAQRIVIQPAGIRFGADPFEVDIRAFTIDRIRQGFPSFDVVKTSVDDLLIKPISLILEPLRREILAISIQQSLQDPSLLLESEADALVANLLISRINGSRARGVARLFFNAAVNFVALPNATLLTADGIRFHPTQVQSITATEMQSNVENNFFFFDINVEAEDEGADGEIEPGDLTRIEDAPGVVRVINKARFTGGINRQSNTELRDFAEKSVTERSLTTERGVISQLLDNFAVEDVIPIGFGDPEMDRDIIESIGALLDSATLSATASITSGVLTDSAKDFSGSGTDVRVGDIVTFFNGVNAGSSFTVAVVGTTTLDLTGPPTPADQSSPITYFVTQRTFGTLTISGIPGGILSTAPVSVPNNQVHIGNHTDAYVKTPALDQDSVDLLSLPSPDDATIVGDKDLLDTSLIDVDLISYVKFKGFGKTSDGLATFTTSEPLRRFGLVKNDIIRFLSPAILVGVGNLRVDAITDADPLVLTLKNPDGSVFVAPVTANGAEFELVSTSGAIQPTQMPLVRVTRVDLMNSADPPQPIGGVSVPYQLSVDVQSSDFFSSGATPAVGRFRVYYLEPTTVQFDAGDLVSILGTTFRVDFEGQTLYYRPDAAAVLGDLGVGVRKVRDPDLAAPSLIDSDASSGKFTAADTFELDADTFSGDVDPGDLLIIRDAAGLVTGNFYVTTGVLSGGTLIKVTPDFTGVIPTTGLGWEIIAQEDLTSQRISAKDMAKNVEGSLFFVDIAAKSYDNNTTGAAPASPGSNDDVDDGFSITDKLLAILVGERSIGYSFKQNTNPSATREASLALSIQERLILSFTDRFMQITVSDFTQSSIVPSGEGATKTGVPAAFRPLGNLNNTTTALESRNVRVNFEKAPVIQDIQSFVNLGTGRVITENILIKNMVPAFVDADVEYEGGLSEEQILPLVRELIDETDSVDPLEVSDIEFLIRDRGEANDVQLQGDLIAVVYNRDRTISVDRSQREILVSRISHFYPGRILLTRL